MLTATFMSFLGFQAGRILTTFQDDRSRIVRFIAWGVFISAIATALCGGTKFTGAMPISKNLWSPSFIFLLSGLGYLLLAVCYYVVDVKRWWTGAPFKYVGKNSILIYIGHELLSDYFPFTTAASFSCPKSHPAMMFSNLIGVTTWVVISWLLFKRGIFVTV